MAGTLTISTLSDGTYTTSSTNLVRGPCVAWVNFNGTTSPGTIRASYNVSSVTKNGTGDYTTNFTNALTDANYATQFTVQNDVITAYGYCTGISLATSPTTTAVRLSVFRGYDGAARDTAIGCVACFR